MTAGRNTNENCVGLTRGSPEISRKRWKRCIIGTSQSRGGFSTSLPKLRNSGVLFVSTLALSNEFDVELTPPAPVPRARPLGPISLLRVLAKNPLEARASIDFEQPIVTRGMSIGRVVVVNDPAAIRRVLFDNCENYRKDWLQRRVLSAGLTGGLLTAEGQNWRVQRRVLAPLFARKTVISFSEAMLAVANGLAERLAKREGEVVDIAVEGTRATLEVLERTIFSDGLGRASE